MLNAEPDTTSDILSENGSHHTSIVPALPSSHHPSPHRPGVMVESGVRVRQGFEGGGGLAENVACLE
jgi:hypothetical protein